MLLPVSAVVPTGSVKSLPQKARRSKRRAQRTVVRCALPIWELGPILALGASSAHREYHHQISGHLQSAAGLIRLFCQLKQYSHQFRVI